MKGTSCGSKLPNRLPKFWAFNRYTVKPVLSSHLLDKEKVAL